jgi:hypothetical protein
MELTCLRWYPLNTGWELLVKQERNGLSTQRNKGKSTPDTLLDDTTAPAVSPEESCSCGMVRTCLYLSLYCDRLFRQSLPKPEFQEHSEIQETLVGGDDSQPVNGILTRTQMQMMARMVPNGNAA